MRGLLRQVWDLHRCREAGKQVPSIRIGKFKLAALAGSKMFVRTTRICYPNDQLWSPSSGGT